ncbi:MULTISPECIES: hypothetical protein [unclassified Streptomyces]|uniref:hypothetical protein n=1 Tax=unclassified Streptomyces TaxID=2593676 RepID=UPI000F740715|nr:MULTISPECIES: hypothetical protein [unclassified Streptomyces]
MRTSTTDIESGLVDLSGCGLREAMALSGDPIAKAQEALLAELAREAAGQNAGGPYPSPFSPVRCDAPED